MTADDGAEAALNVVEWPGPITSRAGRLLALLGHRVTRVGPAAVGGPWDAGKATIDLTDARHAAAEADVVLFGTGGGLDPESTAAAGPHVVVATPWGRAGARAAWPASDHVVAAAGGWSAQVGRPDGPPISPPDEQAWALTAVAATIAALLGSPGEVSEVAAIDVVTATLEAGALAWIHDGRTMPRPGRDHPLVVHQLLRAVDGWVATGLGGNESMWERLRDWVSSEGDASLQQPAYESSDGRLRNRARLAADLQRFCSTRTRDALTREAQARRVPWAGVLEPGEVVTSAHLVARGFMPPAADGAIARVPWLTTLGPEREPPPMPAADSSRRRLLHGITVLDLTWVLAGPFATRILADHGADVVKVESLARPDPTRFSPAMHLGAARPAGTGETSGYFANHNRNKRSVALNLRHPDGLPVLRRLVAGADVVVDNFSAGTLSSWGLGPRQLWELRPDLVIAELSGMGQTGPWRDYVSYADAVSALSGLTALTTDSDGESIGVVFGLADLVGGYHGALAIVAALWQLSRTGRGAYLDLAQLEAMAFNLSCSLSAAALGQAIEPRLGDVMVPCADGEWCAASLGGDGDVEAIRRQAATVDAETLAAALRSCGTAAARVADGRHLVETDPDLGAMPMYAAVEHPVIGEHLVELDPIVVDGVRPPVRRGAPLLGADTRDVLTTLAGYTDAEIDDLETRGVLR